MRNINPDCWGTALKRCEDSYDDYGKLTFNPYDLGTINPCLLCNRLLMYQHNSVACPPHKNCRVAAIIRNSLAEKSPEKRTRLFQTFLSMRKEHGPPVRDASYGNLYDHRPESTGQSLLDEIRALQEEPDRDKHKNENKRASKPATRKRRIIWEPKKKRNKDSV